MNAPIKSRRSWRSLLTDPEMVTSLAAIVIGLCALVLSGVQIGMMREEQHKSVWPRLELEVYTHIADHSVTSFEDTTAIEVEIRVRNKGVGPALVSSMEVTLDGKPEENLFEAIEKVFPRRYFGGVTSSLPDKVLLPGEEVHLYVFSLTTTEKRARAGVNRIGTQICYCSTYDDCWLLRKDRLSASKPVYEQSSDCRKFER